MTKLTSHQQFFQHTTALARELSAIEKEVKHNEQQLFVHINTLTHAVKMASKAKQPEIVRDAVQVYFAQTSAVLTAWQKKVSSYEAGLSFRKKFGDSVLVFVYGKVKAGKSSLGNYVATGRSKPDDAWLSHVGQQLHQPQFFSEEINQAFNEKIDYTQGFQVGEDETTSCIQGFTVPGLTWIDSPGLHSTHTQNGDLAQKYVESADLIIYPMSSAQPCRSTDLEELKDLLQAGKRILVLITRSDRNETDIDDETGAIVHTRKMKADADRQDQEMYAQEALKTLCQKLSVTDADTSALSISVAYAEEQDNSPEAIQASGLQGLFNKLEDILSSEGIALKKQVPQRNLQAFYQALLDKDTELSLAGLLDPLSAALAALAEQQGLLEAITEQAQNRIHYQLAHQIDDLVEKYAGSRDMTALNDALQQVISQAIADEYQQPLKDLFQTTLSTVATATQDMGLHVDLSFSDKTCDITVDVSQKSAAIAGGVGVAVGGFIGFFLGGPAGAAAGSMLGGLVGGQAGSSFNSQETRTISYGDNREEIKSLLIQKSHQLVNSSLTQLKHEAADEVLLPVNTALKQVYQQALTLQKFIQEHVKNV